MNRLAVFLASVAMVLALVSGQDLQMSATPSNVVNGTTDSLKISCKAPNVKNGDTLFILLQIEHLVDDNEVLIATQKQLGGTEVHENGDKNITAEGGLSVSEGVYLTVNIASPGVDDTGKYQCRLGYLNMKEFRFTVLNTTFDVTFTEPDEPTPPPVVADSCSCDQIWEEVKSLRETVLAENRELRERLKSYNDSCRVSFTAGIEQETGLPFRSNSPVIFDSVVSNKGDAYNPSKGIFSAPCSGQYFFRLSMRTHQERATGYVDAAIEVNGEEVARTSVFTADTMDHFEQASNGVVLSLATDDEVQVRIQTNSAGYIFGGKFSIFSGFFLSA